jgi:uncharacterized membrane protein
MLTKTMSFAVVHFTVAFTVGYLLSGSVLIGSAIAMVEPAVNTVAYYFHEKLWNRLSAQRRSNLPLFSTGA